MEVKPIGDKKQTFELSPIVKISLTLNFATSPEGGSEFCDTLAASTEEFTSEEGSETTLLTSSHKIGSVGIRSE